jgi:hypothetical protein
MEVFESDALECAQRCWQAAKGIECEETRAALDQAAWKYLERDRERWGLEFNPPLPRASAGGRPARGM